MEQNFLTKEQATTFFSILFGGEHHIPRGGIKQFGSGWSVINIGDLATYDFNTLTRLVILAHEMCIRASVMNGGPNAVKIAIWKKDRNGTDTSTRHPTLEENIELIKKYRWPTDIDKLIPQNQEIQNP